MNRDGCAQPPRLFDGSGQLRLGVLVRGVQRAVDHSILAGLVDLGKVRAFLVLLSHDFHKLLSGVGVVGIGKHMLGGVVADGVLVAAENVDGVAAHAQPGAENESLVDGVADGGIGRTGALCSHIALGGEPGHQVCPGGLDGENCSPGHRLDHGLQVLGPGMQKEVNVGVNQPGEEGYIAQVDDLGALRTIYRSADGADAFALDQDFARLDQPSRVDLEEPGGMEDDGRLAGGLAGGAEGHRRSAAQQRGGTETEGAGNQVFGHG